MGYKLTENHSLAQFSSMKAGGNAKYIAEPKNEQELLEAIKDFRTRNEKYIIVGNCSNILFRDEGFDGCVIVTTSVKGIEVNGNEITVSCGESLAALAVTAWKNSLTGFEFCHGIPGTVGGGVFMNAGAYGGELSQRFIKGRFLNKDLEIIEFSNEDMEFGYRKSRMMKEELVLLSAVFMGEKGSSDEIRSKMNELMEKRREKQPLEFPSCGSTFKRPEGHFAGALIEQCGLKGAAVGGAEVSEKHAGFVINSGNATATDVIKLMELVSKKVFEETGVQLEPEIRII